MIYKTSHLPEPQKVLKTDLQWMTYFNYYAQPTSNGTIESWPQAVERATENLRMLSNNAFSESEYQEIHDAIYLHHALPSMRLFSMSKAAIERDHTVIYNCAFLPIDTFVAIAEIVFLTMSGNGVGYSVENNVIKHLPAIPEIMYDEIVPYVIEDTQAGWADSVKYLFKSITENTYPRFDYSLLRPAGAPLKTKGGVSSGPEPLKKYHQHVLDILDNAQGRQLTSIEVHDIVNMISECAISNGSRSGALICLFDDNDKDMLNAKADPLWYEKTPWRAYSNNSVVVNGTTHEFIGDIANQLIFDEAGEPGLFSRQKYLNSGRNNDENTVIGVNPCGEVFLQGTLSNSDPAAGGGQFCNLSTVVLDNDAAIDGLELHKRVRIATLIGTIQANATDFAYLRKGWKENCDSERLLGVCITGIYDYKEYFDKDRLTAMKQLIEYYNKKYAKKLGINPATSITSVKPSGNTSVLTNTSPGVNPDFGQYQIRNVRVGTHSKMAKFLIEQGVPYVEDPFQSTKGKFVFSFPKKSKSANTLETATAKEQIENYLLWADYYTTHNVSVTITYKEDEKQFVADWIKENYKHVTGMAFFPETPNMPYLPINVVTLSEYMDMLAKHPVIDWREFYDYDGEHVRQTIAECSGERCDIVW